MFKSNIKSLLSKRSQEREAQKLTSPNIKPRFFKRGLRRLTVISVISLYLLGLNPFITFPPKQSVTFAQEQQQQVQTVESEAIPVFQLPHPGYITTRYSRWHPGIDLCTSLGMPIHPIYSGTVETIEKGFLGYGNHVIVNHGNGYSSLYGHMDKLYVTVGQTVTTEDVLGTVGMTGFTSGPHTHLEIYKEGKSVDPLGLLPEIQTNPSPEYLQPVGGYQESSESASFVEYKPVVVATPEPTINPHATAKPRILPSDTGMISELNPIQSPKPSKIPTFKFPF